MTMDIISNYTDTTLPFNDTGLDTLTANITKPPWSLMEKMIFGTWLTISMLCAICGNFMVIVVVIRHKGMRTRTNMFLVNLAVADFLVGTLLAPLALTTLIMESWPLSDVWCQINGFLNAVCFITSIHTLMYISIHKYVSITRPFSRILNHWKILIMIACSWLWAVICAILTMILSKIKYKPGTMQCGPEYPQNNAEYFHHLIIQITGILFPLGIMIFAYARMYCEFRQHAIRLRRNTTLQSDQILGQQIKVTKTLFIVLACFMLCWLPYAGYTSYVAIIKDKRKIYSWANALAYCFMYMNSGCNPIIYAWRSPSFREGYKEILCQKSSYIVSDDTIRDSDSPSIIRRLSTLLHSSFRSTRVSMKRHSDDASSPNSPYISRTASVSSPTHNLLKRATSKTAKGSSIIRKDGAVIITKNGKIISVRHDTDMLRRDRSFSGFEEMRGNHENGVSKSLSDFNILHRDRLELSPLLARTNRLASCSSLSNRSLQSAGSDNNNKFCHTSLTKIDSVDETEIENNTKPLCKNRQSCSSIKETQDSREATPQVIQEHVDECNSPSVKSDLDEVFVTSPVTILFNSQENILNEMPLEPSLKKQQHFSKSEMQLDVEISKHISNNTSNAALSRSSNVVYKVPLLKCPSLERLDVPAGIPRCSSDASSIKRLEAKSPLYKRRWLSNKRVDQIKTTKA